MQEKGNMNKEYMHVWGDSFPCIPNPLCFKRKKGLQSISCLVPESVN